MSNGGNHDHTWCVLEQFVVENLHNSLYLYFSNKSFEDEENCNF